MNRTHLDVKTPFYLSPSLPFKSDIGSEPTKSSPGPPDLSLLVSMHSSWNKLPPPISHKGEHALHLNALGFPAWGQLDIHRVGEFIFYPFLMVLKLLGRVLLSKLPSSSWASSVVLSLFPSVQSQSWFQEHSQGKVLYGLPQWSTLTSPLFCLASSNTGHILGGPVHSHQSTW